MQGGLAGALAANRFSVMHPDRIKAIAMFSTGLPALKGIHQLIIAGDKDDNDPILYLLHKQESLIPFVKSAFGQNPCERAIKYAEYLKKAGVSVRLQIYKGHGHSLPKPEVRSHMHDSPY